MKKINQAWRYALVISAAQTGGWWWVQGQLRLLPKKKTRKDRRRVQGFVKWSPSSLWFATEAWEGRESTLMCKHLRVANNREGRQQITGEWCGGEGKDEDQYSRQVCSARLQKEGLWWSNFLVLSPPRLSVFTFTFSLSLSFPQSFRAAPP